MPSREFYLQRMVKPPLDRFVFSADWEKAQTFISFHEFVRFHFQRLTRIGLSWQFMLSMTNSRATPKHKFECIFSVSIYFRALHTSHTVQHLLIEIIKLSATREPKQFRVQRADAKWLNEFATMHRTQRQRDKLWLLRKKRNSNNWVYLFIRCSN